MSFLGSFPQAAIILTFSFACALVLAFVCLRIVVGLVTREQYNVTDAPRRIRAIVLVDRSGKGWSTADGGRSRTTGRSYLLPAAAPRNRFARPAQPDDAGAGRVIELSQRDGGRTAQGRAGDGGNGAA